MRVIWNQALGVPECPYLRRWVLDLGPLGSVRLHRWYGSDDDRALHDHPWWFITLVLRGGYDDYHGETDGKYDVIRAVDRVRAPAVRFRPAHHRHTVQVHGGGATTLLLTGPESRPWGFWVKKANGKLKFLEHRRYFRRFGHHPCDDA